ncbi:cleavage stimulation factor subunit [Arachis hypogaea]|nr:cleavage stimulation factor subunit [Arachis hypogaea]
MTRLTVEAPPNKLLELVANGLAVEKDDVFKGTLSSPFCDLGALVLPTHPGATIIDFRQFFSADTYSFSQFEVSVTV